MGKRTPAMNKPNVIPNLFILATPMLVSAGLQKLPGASLLDIPSKKTTAINRIIEKIPMIEVYESKERGRNTVGIILFPHSKIRLGDYVRMQFTYNNNPQTLYVSTEYCGKIACRESAYKVTRITLKTKKKKKKVSQLDETKMSGGISTCQKIVSCKT